MPSRPIVGIPSDLKMIDPHPYHTVGDKYVRAVSEAAGAVPMLIPALGDALDVDDVLDLVDGVLLTGSYANVHPRRYGGGEPYDGSPLDTDRDATTLRLIPEILQRAIPLFGVCRGFQEINVALGGTLHQKVHEQPDYDRHLENPDDPLDVQYGPSHSVRFVSGGLLHKLAGASEAEVNSLHGQGVDRIADGLVAEAHAPDGLIEAFRVADAPEFAIAVQWHPEWRATENPFYSALWRAFGDACRCYRSARLAGAAPLQTAAGS